jgi:demethoxyubiquinone hydroxylase (CLK1/Coq7/Cat5 family)
MVPLCSGYGVKGGRAPVSLRRSEQTNHSQRFGPRPWRNVLKRTRAAEQQAIAIYSAEVFWRGGGPDSPLKQTLEEEESHDRHLSGDPEARQALPTALESYLNRGMGWAVGSFLALLPDRWLYSVHVWAELQAAQIYSRGAGALEAYWADPAYRPAMEKAWQPKEFLALVAQMRSAARQEEGHAERFRRLGRKKTFSDAPFQSKNP